MAIGQLLTIEHLKPKKLQYLFLKNHEDLMNLLDSLKLWLCPKRFYTMKIVLFITMGVVNSTPLRWNEFEQRIMKIVYVDMDSVLVISKVVLMP